MVLSFGQVLFAVIYAVSLCSAVAVFASILFLSRKWLVRPSLHRLFGLVKEESKRLKSLDPVFLMHVSIALGVGLSIVEVILEPVWRYFPILEYLLLALSLPLIVGLSAAFFWRVQRLAQSKDVEKNLLGVDPSFTMASNVLQAVLIVAIILTATELVLAFFPNFYTFDEGICIARNCLVLLYYSRPSINLLANFDRPLASVKTPFRLADVLEGKVDPSQITVGANKASQFESYQKLSYDSCVEIGACESACPATAAGRPLSPRVLVREISLFVAQKGEDANLFDSVKEEELWSCVTCGACVHSCPVAVKHLDLIYELRRSLVNSGKIDKNKSTLLDNLARNQNPYGFNSKTRADWAVDNDIPILSLKQSTFEYLYWVGCVSSFDKRAQNVAKSVAKILKKARVSFAILGTEEMCNGDPARRLGEESRFQELAYQNIERLNSYNVKKIVTSCPHCFNTLKNEYPNFGGKYEVIHHTQLISDLIRDGRINLGKEKTDAISVTLHDACYVARYNSIFEEPRRILYSATNDVREMGRNRDRTFCCGAGGSNYWYKVSQQRRSITSIRTLEAAETGASTIATECPFCLSMFEDSTKTSGVSMNVKDLAEIIAEELL